MCIPTIIDASAFGAVLDPRAGTEFRSWIDRGHGRVVYSNHGDYWEELAKSRRMLRLIADYRRADRARLVNADSVQVAEASLRNATTRSGAKDKPVLALAKASDALVLCSRDDGLKNDFRNVQLLPKVGRRKRSVYPIDQRGAVRRQFLEQRRCRQRPCP